MNIEDLNIQDIFEAYGTIMLIIIIVKIIYDVILIAKIWETASNTTDSERLLRDIYNNQVDEEENQKKIIELLEQQNEKLERIANALEQQDSEPYIIEKDE